MTEEFPQKIGDYQILLTRDYLVINTLKEVVFIKKSEIPPLTENFSKQAQVVLTRIHVDRLLDSDQLKKEGGFKIYSLEDEDFETVSQTQIRSNCFQISFAEEHIMWDLDSNEEISFLTG